MHLITYLNVSLNLTIPGVARKDTVGHFVLTNIGTLGMTAALAPLCPPMHSIGLTCAGKIVKKPMMIDGKVEIQSMINTTNTGDHRFGDASIMLPLCNVFKYYLKDPKAFDINSIKENVHYSEKK